MVLLPEGNELSLAELREMAARQQHQIEAHQQLLVAKEQRLKFLKQQEARHHHQGCQQGDGDRVRHLREKVELQELKLRRLRTLRGQVEQHRSNNTNLNAELESIRALFNEKEKELSVAVAKVEELTRQLEDVRRGDITNVKQGNTPSPAALEFQKLRRELLYRSKLNEQQNARIAHQRETLARRQSEISEIDQRIAELQQRLQRKRLLNQQLSNQLYSANRLRPRTNVATVEPLKRAAQDIELIPESLKSPGESTEFTPNKKDPKYQTLPYNTKFLGIGAFDSNQKIFTPPHNGERVDEQQFVHNGAPPPYPDPLLRLLAPGKPVPRNGPGNPSQRHFGPTARTSFLNSGHATRGSQKQQIQRSVIASGSGSTTNVVTTSASNSKLSVTTAPPSGSRSKSPVSLPNHQVALPPTVMTSGLSAVPRTVPQTPARQHISPGFPHMRSRKTESSSAPKPAVPPKPSTPNKPNPPPRQLHTIGSIGNPYNHDNVNQALSVLKGSSQGSESSRLGLKFPSSGVHQRVVPSFNTHSQQKPDTLVEVNRESNNENDSNVQKHQASIDATDNGHTTENTAIHVLLNRRIGMPPSLLFPEGQASPSDVDSNDITEIHSLASRRRPFTQDGLQILEQSHNALQADTEELKITLALQSSSTDSPIGIPETNPSNDTTANQQHSGENEYKLPVSPDTSSKSFSDLDSFTDPITAGAASRRIKKGNLKTKGAVKNSRRVSFDPLALLLDAALEGELELVKKTAKEVANPSAANDEGITALHNAICAGHIEIVKFLVEFGCDVNAQDSDGWTPLHCAASCNNLAMVKYLVERGACIFASTLSDHETAAEKCEEDEEGFDGCSEYLYSMQEKLGILNCGIVYALYDYESQNSDELCFHDGNQLVVLRKGDDLEREWWWSKQNDREGYVPRNLLGLYPRVTAKGE